MNCPNCNRSVAPGTKFCAACGTPIPQDAAPVNNIPPQPPVNDHSAPRPAGKGPSRKPLLIGALAAVAVVLIGVLVFLWTSGANTPEKKVERSVQKSSQALEDHMDQMENFSKVSDTLTEVSQKGNFTMTMNMEQSMNMSMEDGSYGYARDMEYIINASSEKKTMDLSYTLNMDDQQIVLKGYLDQNSLQFGLPDLLDDVYGMPLDNLSKALEKTYVGELLEDMDLDLGDLSADDLFRTETDPEVQEKMDAFRSSIVVSPREEKETLELDKDRKCTAYEITFGQNELEDLLEVLFDEKNNPFMAMMMGSGMDALDIDEITEVVEDIELTGYVDDRGYFVGADIEYDGETACLRLAGVENPWEEIRFYPEENEDEGFVITMDVNDSGLKLGMELAGERLFCLEYADSDGEITLEASGEDVTASMKIHLTQDGDRSAFSLEYQEEYDGYSSSTVFNIGIGPLANDPQPLSDEYINILEMDEDDFEALGEELEGALFGASDDYDYDSDISYETEPVEEVTEP